MSAPAPQVASDSQPRRSWGEKWRKRWHTLRDWIWVTVEAPSSHERQREKERDENRKKNDKKLLDDLANRDEPQLESALEECRRLLDAENDRKSGAETRLAGTLAFSSVITGLLFNVFSNLLKDNRAPTVVVGVALVAWGYVVLQLVRAALAAVAGLKRRGYLHATPEEVLPNGDEARTVLIRRQIGVSLECLRDHQEVNNTKVTQMDVAHTAIRNFLAGVVAAMVVTILALTTQSGPTDEALVAKLRGDPKLIELLRGPRGESGPRGPQGERGQQGPKGDRGDEGATGPACTPCPPQGS